MHRCSAFVVTHIDSRFSLFAQIPAQNIDHLDIAALDGQMYWRHTAVITLVNRFRTSSAQMHAQQLDSVDITATYCEK